MARKKKIEEVLEVFVEKKEPDYGSGWNRINNMLQEGFKLEQITEEKRNE